MAEGGGSTGEAERGAEGEHIDKNGSLHIAPPLRAVSAMCPSHSLPPRQSTTLSCCGNFKRRPLLSSALVATFDISSSRAFGLSQPSFRPESLMVLRIASYQSLMETEYFAERHRTPHEPSHLLKLGFPGGARMSNHRYDENHYRSSKFQHETVDFATTSKT